MKITFMIPKEHKLVLANKKYRFLNYLIDLVIRIILVILLIRYTRIDNWFSDDVFFRVYFLSYSVEFLYYFSLEFLFGNTIARILTNSKLVNYDLCKPSKQQIFVRNLSRMIPFEIISFFSEETGNGWHDKFSKTYVISERKLKQYEAVFEIDSIGKTL